jgi:Ulp1 family protease
VVQLKEERCDIFLPKSIDNKHWILGYLQIQKVSKVLIVFDSIIGNKKELYFSNIFKKIIDMTNSKVEVIIANSPQQNDDFSCGIYVLKIIEEIAKMDLNQRFKTGNLLKLILDFKKKFKDEKFDIKQFRKKVREKLFPIDPPLKKKTIVNELEIEEINSDDVIEVESEIEEINSDDIIEQEEIISWQKKN